MEVHRFLAGDKTTANWEWIKIDKEPGGIRREPSRRSQSRS